MLAVCLFQHDHFKHNCVLAEGVAGLAVPIYEMTRAIRHCGFSEQGQKKIKVLARYSGAARWMISPRMQDVLSGFLADAPADVLMRDNINAVLKFEIQRYLRYCLKVALYFKGAFISMDSVRSPDLDYHQVKP